MNLRAFVSAGVALAVTAAVWAQAPVPAETKTTAPKADAKTAPTKKDDKKKKADEMGKIEGMEIPRGTGFLGVQILNGVFKITVYNAKKKPTAADFTRIALRWQPANQKSPERTLLLPAGGIGAFSSEKIVKPPHRFRLFITLIKGDGDDAPVENLTLEFQA